MDALSDVLAPYSDIIGKFAGAVTCLQFLSGIMLMNDIRKKGKSDAYPPEPFLGGVVLSILSIKFGMLMGDQTMVTVNVIGLVISVIFMLMFYYYATSEYKSKIWVKIGYASLFSLGCLAYTNFEDPAKLAFRFSMLLTTILVMLVGMPLLNLGEIMRKKSTEGLPFPLILSGTVVAASWAVYGISIRNPTVVYQNLLLLTLSAIQLSLFAIYPNTSEASDKSSEKKSPKIKSNDKEKKQN